MVWFHILQLTPFFFHFMHKVLTFTLFTLVTETISGGSIAVHIRSITFFFLIESRFSVSVPLSYRRKLL